MNFSELSSDSLMGVRVKLEQDEIAQNENSMSRNDFFNDADTAFARADDDETREVFNSALVEDLSSNEKILNDINRFIAIRREKLNRKNLINYCGILDANNENDGCARVNSIFVAKFGKSHIKKTKIINHYGALSQMYHQELAKLQKEKLLQYTSSYVVPLDMSKFKSNMSN